MKGLTHFISGVAFGTFFPSAVAAAEAKSLILVLGGVGGILPDTFDFKFARFLEKFDIEVDPDHDDPNPQKIADAVADAINRADKEQKTIKLLLHTIRMGADAWRKYSVYFNSEKQRIEVTIGPVVTTSQVPYLPSLPPPEKRFACAPVKVPFVHTYDRANDVTIFSGPDFDMKPRDGYIEIEFLSWHRRWSHSLTLAAVGGVITTILAYLLKAVFSVQLALAPWMYGLILAGGGCMHILEDQTGFMGSNLLYPFTKERATGAKWFHSGHAISNFTTFYLMVSLIIFNLNRLTPPKPVFDVAWWEYWLVVFIIPMTLLHTIAAMWSDPLPETHVTDDTHDIGVEASEDGGGI